jgi:hypothetical protein
MPIYAIVKYHCEIDGEVSSGVDYQVRYFKSDSEEEVIHKIKSEDLGSYKNTDGETVKWIFDEIMSVEQNPQFEDGEEIIGFTTEE